MATYIEKSIRKKSNIFVDFRKTRETPINIETPKEIIPIQKEIIKQPIIRIPEKKRAK